MPREMRDTLGNPCGLFKFTVCVADQIRPVGYCGGWPYDQPLPRWAGPGFEVLTAEERRRALPFREKFHANGHQTRESAAACYRAYLLDIRTDYDGRHPERQERCLSCGAWTQGYARVDGWEMLALCDQHRNREVLEVLYHPIGERWQS